jgi:hypothetical protein
MASATLAIVLMASAASQFTVLFYVLGYWPYSRLVYLEFAFELCCELKGSVCISTPLALCCIFILY